MQVYGTIYLILEALLFELSNCLMFNIKASPLQHAYHYKNFQTQTLYISLTHSLATTDYMFYIDIARSYSSDASDHPQYSVIRNQRKRPRVPRKDGLCLVSNNIF